MAAHDPSAHPHERRHGPQPARLEIPYSDTYYLAAPSIVADSNSVSSTTQITPPSSPTSRARTVISAPASRLAHFHNFMRAFYDFRPMAALSAEDNETSVTVTLQRGDVILIHSVQPNGWADGTVLSTGARGWLPTNYCEPFEHASVHGLLNAVTHVWDYARLQAEQLPSTSHNQDYMHGMIAGVRRFLERSHCLSSDSPLVQHHEGVRRTRKALLADLASFRTAAARFEANTRGAFQLTDSGHDLLDDIVFKSFRVVLRAVRFLDAWSKDYLLGAYHEAAERSAEKPLTPPPDSAKPRIVKEAEVAALEESKQPDRPAYGPRTSSMRYSQLVARTTPASTRSDLTVSSSHRQISASHRLSCLPQALSTHRSLLASETLQSTHEIFLGHVGAFIGLHLHSRRSEDVLMNTQQSVVSCKALLAVVTGVAERDPLPSDDLGAVHEQMLSCLRQLVQATRDMFKNIQTADDTNYLVNDREKDLVEAATACVKAAGECVSETRLVLERIGDFEIDQKAANSVPPSDRTSDSHIERSRSGNKSQPGYGEESHQDVQTPPTSAAAPTLRHRASELGSVLITRNTIDDESSHKASATLLNSATQFEFPTLQVEIPMLSPILLSSSARNSSISLQLSRPKSASTSLAESNTTFSASVRSSEASTTSQISTRATSLEKSPKEARQAHTALTSRDSLNDFQSSAGGPEDVEAQLLAESHAHELVFNKEGQIVGGSIAALVERLTAHDSTPEATFVNAFFMTFRLFTSPMELAQCLITRFEKAGDQKAYSDPVRLRVFNVFKQWMETQWQTKSDEDILPLVEKFANDKMKTFLPSAGKRLHDMARNLRSFEGTAQPHFLSTRSRTTSTLGFAGANSSATPQSIITKNQLSLLRSKTHHCSIMDFDAVEIARQLTLTASSLYCAIKPEELLASEWTKQTDSKSVHVKAMSTMATDLANLVADTILHCSDPKKRATIIKHWVKIASQCLELSNYDSLMAIVCSLNSSMVVRLSRTWELVSAKTTERLETLKAAVNVAKNHTTLRNRLQMHVGPCVPFVGMYLTDLTFVDVGNQSTRLLPEDGMSRQVSVINFDKYLKTARIISELQRFQIPYTLAVVPELQDWLEGQARRVRTSEECSVQNYYRRSLLLEPRKAAQGGTDAAGARAITKDRFDFWTSLTFQSGGGAKEKRDS